MAGNITEAQNTYGKTLYQYDKGGRLIYQKDITTGEEISFEYDAAGNRTRLYSSNRDTSYAYGSNNEVKEIFDNKQRVSVKLAYNKNGSEVLRKFGNGTSEETLYDKAGRVIVRLQKSERNELLWAEGYVYGDDGKRTATVDKSCRLTLYEYNKKGQIQNVYYPYSQEQINNLKKEAEENGLPTNIDIGENQYLNSDLRAKVVPLLNAMQYGLAYSLPNMQSFIKESYTYDGNGNRIGKTTKYGTINYSYDKENCLISSGSMNQAFVNYTYDNAGNLLTEESANKVTKYAYNAQNRLIYCEVLDKAEKTYAQTTYAYDAFGRRVLVQDKDEAALRTLYDGLTFDVIKQSPVMANGLFTDSAETGIRWSPTGKPTGDRYRYISDEDAQDDNRYFYLDENTYKTVNTRYKGARTAITVNGTITAQITGEGAQYFTTDLSGSVSSVTDSYGYQLGEYTYDAFGSLVQGDLSDSTDFGYLGKQSDPTSKLYNYGYRDYKPEAARFTTVDPVRDGSNWFTYVNNDPVNFVDLWGLEVSDNKGSNGWTEEAIKEYREFVPQKIGEYIQNGEKYTCEDLALAPLIDYAYENGLPVTIKNGSGTYSSADYPSVKKYKKAVLSATGANDLMYNTVSINVSEIQAGDIMLMDTGDPYGTKDGEMSHTLVAVGVSEPISSYKQGNTKKGSSKYGSLLYSGEEIANGTYNSETDVFIGRSGGDGVYNAKDSFGMEYRRWNFKEF